MLEMKGIVKKFDAVVALNGASLTAKSGRIMALLGSNGSGKSTLVKVLGGLVYMNEGEIIIDDEPRSIKSSFDSLRNGVAIAYQDLSLIPTMSVIDNMVLGLEPLNKLGLIDHQKAREICVELLRKLKVNVDLDAMVQTLVPSMQSMIEIAKAMSSNPKILILDEATASLHADEVENVFKLLEEIKKDGTIIIVVSHRMNEIFRICDDCTILKNGVTVAQDKVENLNLDDIVFHMTGKRFDTESTQEHIETIVGDKVLEVKNLGMFPKLKDVNFNVNAGEIVGIGGLDGQGQSEFIRAIIADVKHTSGQILINGKEVHFKSSSDAVNNEIGFISGDRAGESIFPIRSVAHNIYAGNIAKGKLFKFLNPKQVKGFAKKVIDEYGVVVGGLDFPANTLSGGNQQKLVIGRWIALNPKLLLLDDPTKGVDIQSRREIHTFLHNCAKNGMSIVYVSSDNDELFEIADRVYVFYEGSISAILAGKNKTKEKMVSAMLGLYELEEEVIS